MADIEALNAEIVATREHLARLEGIKAVYADLPDILDGLSVSVDTSAFRLTMTATRPEVGQKEYVQCPEGCGTKLQVDGPGARKPTVHYKTIHDMTKEEAQEKAPELDELRALPRVHE